MGPTLIAIGGVVALISSLLQNGNPDDSINNLAYYASKLGLVLLAIGIIMTLIQH